MTKEQAKIILAFANNGMRVRHAARQVFMDDGTVQYHLRKVKAATGRDPKNFYDLCYLVGIAAQMGGGK